MHVPNHLVAHASEEQLLEPPTIVRRHDDQIGRGGVQMVGERGWHSSLEDGDGRANPERLDLVRDPTQPMLGVVHHPLDLRITDD